MSFRNSGKTIQSHYTIKPKYTGERNGYIELLEFQNVGKLSIYFPDNMKAKELYEKICMYINIKEINDSESQSDLLLFDVACKDNKILITGNLKDAIDFLEEKAILAVVFVMAIYRDKQISQIINKNHTTNNSSLTSNSFPTFFSQQSKEILPLQEDSGATSTKKSTKKTNSTNNDEQRDNSQKTAMSPCSPCNIL